MKKVFRAAIRGWLELVWCLSRKWRRSGPDRWETQEESGVEGHVAVIKVWYLVKPIIVMVEAVEEVGASHGQICIRESTPCPCVARRYEENESGN